MSRLLSSGFYCSVISMVCQASSNLTPGLFWQITCSLPDSRIETGVSHRAARAARQQKTLPQPEQQGEKFRGGDDVFSLAGKGQERE